MALLLALFLVNILTIFPEGSSSSQSVDFVHHQIHLLHPKSGAAGNSVQGLSCLSWRLDVETNNIIRWKTLPRECEGYVGHYMLGHQYRKDSETVVYEAFLYAQSLVKLANDGSNVWIFDVDETSLSNLPYFAHHGFGAEPFNATSFDKWVKESKAPALPECLKLYGKLLSLGIKVVFLTGRSEDERTATASNLKKVGYHTWLKLILRQQQFEMGKSAVVYKSGARKKLEEKGYRIIGNIGDQWSDLLGTITGNRTFKLPDPMYYIS